MNLASKDSTRFIPQTRGIRTGEQRRLINPGISHLAELSFLQCLAFNGVLGGLKETKSNSRVFLYHPIQVLYSSSFAVLSVFRSF